ncbi:5'-methylthioadenosine/S-adenosylhomocysteine nucleosidase [Candidatus Gracilibacteria bacterium]|nr:MAG: 5'-methylthioadenosine/S-adenosylhomocysteine nucleosidase [Candidatus Gracilibacteria bacterium]
MNLTKAIVTAMKEEADLIIKKFGLKETKSLKNIKIFEGTRVGDDGEENIVLVLGGIGKIQAAIATTYLLENYSVDKLINIGIAGNLTGNDLKVGDVILPNTFVQQDMYLPFEGEHLDYAKKPIFLEYAIGENYDLQKFGLILNGVCATGDEFVDNRDRMLELRNDFGADICEMEAFAILTTAREYGILDKCIVIKAISDGADNEAKDAHMNNLEFAMENSIAILEFVL